MFVWAQIAPTQSKCSGPRERISYLGGSCGAIAIVLGVLNERISRVGISAHLMKFLGWGHMHMAPLYQTIPPIFLKPEIKPAPKVDYHGLNLSNIAQSIMFLQAIRLV